MTTIPATNRMAIQISAKTLFLLFTSAQLLAGFLNRNI